MCTQHAVEMRLEEIRARLTAFGETTKNMNERARQINFGIDELQETSRSIMRAQESLAQKNAEEAKESHCPPHIMGRPSALRIASDSFRCFP